MSDTVETESLGSGMATVPMLTSRFSWIAWDRSTGSGSRWPARATCSFAKQRSSTMRRRQLWEEKEERACAAVKSRLARGIERSVEEVEILHTLLEEIK
jgi:hypothetical protein